MQTGRFASFFCSPDKPGTTLTLTVKTMFFRFYQAKVLDCIFCARRPFGLGWREKNHPRYAPVFFSAKPCHKKRPIQGTEACKIGKKHPDGIIHLKKNKNMRLQAITRTVRLAVEGFLLTGVILLCSKGIVPVCTIVFLLMTGEITGKLFRIIGKPFKLLVAILLLAMFL